jgi:hypothetical protein
LAVLAPVGVAFAQNVIDDVNNAMLNIIQNTSASLIDGPPEVANEIAMVDGAMFDAVNAATGGTYASLNYNGGAVSGASASAAALQAAVTVMNNLYVTPGTSLYQQYQGVTGSSYYGASSPYAGTLVGPSTTQMAQVALDVSGIQTELNSLNATLSAPIQSASATLGTAAGNAAITANNASGSQAAMLATLTPYVPPNAGQPGVYVPPASRPALQPTSGTVVPMGMTSAQITAVENSIPPAMASINSGPNESTTGLTSPTYANQVLETECLGSGTALPSAVESVCQANGFAPESAAEAEAALFWNDPGGTLQPPGHWLQIADTVTAETGSDLLQTARATALAAIAMEDAGIATWEVKYKYNAWRPITAIKDCSDWNPNFTTCDSTWTSLINTPPHPDYIAGHPAFSGAAATALEDALGVNDLTFTSSSNSYCNSGTASFDTQGNIIGCTVTTFIGSGSGASCAGPGTIVDGNNDPTDPIGCFYSVSGASCAAGDTPIYDGDTPPSLIGCTNSSGAADSIIGGGCNNAGSQPVLDSNGSANSLYNGSPLICEIAETFDSIQQASGGFLGAEFSRVVGGIHTPDAVTEALALGDDIGNIVASQDLPEPPIAPTLAAGLLILGGLRLRRRSRSRVIGSA